MKKYHKQKTGALVAGFASGLVQVVATAGNAPRRPFPGVGRSSAEALRGDWVKIGGDMRRAANKVMNGTR